MNKVVVVDYGMGNTMSVMRGIEQVGSIPELSGDPDVVRNADRVILPGVGAFESGMGELRKRGLDEAIKSFVCGGRPLLGICLGMQMLLGESEEHGRYDGLGLVPGKVVQIPKDNNAGVERKIPHIGWNALYPVSGPSRWDGSVLDGITDGEYFYFVHSFMVVPDSQEHLLAQCLYDDLRVSAVVAKDNIAGCQFHPEKSGPIGLQVLKNFCLSGQI